MEPPSKIQPDDTDNFVTVVAVGSDAPPTDEVPGYVTVLTIGDESTLIKDIIEEVLVYRLPGERLGFGLKFEGGTKANEFVKRLFIQSCASDSPASRVQSSWGKLTEGDEVLEIDSIPVNTMTRIDCVRCLKDSNVVIKLQVRHFTNDLPQVIAAEKKRTPPPPPPVPPRKVPKKFQKNVESPVPAARQIEKKKFQAPAEPEVYLDLFAQESTLSLSESDDTGSSISTVVDRFASFPTTTTSSLAGSLPSTPTSIQKQLDLSNLINDEEEFLIPNITKSDGTPIQPPSNFQDEDEGLKKPPVPPRSRDLINRFMDENMNISNLPRLVDFVPKSINRDCFENPVDVINTFLENERRETDYLKNEFYEDLDDYDNEIETYSNKWNLSSQLATIGEDEEEGLDSLNRSPISTPIVIVDEPNEDINGKMETLPSDSRQPPDGHEFPDYIENKSEASWNETTTFPLSKINSASNSDLSLRTIEPTLHTRSQSLIDMSIISKPDRWNLLAEQRKKSYSKLKGLVIPEHITETEPIPSVTIPEIISHTPSTFVLETKIAANETTPCQTTEPEPVPPSASPPWILPKYSPAFKRKSLQVYSVIKPKAAELRLDHLDSSPKSLESIASPTRSDCSFDYVTKAKRLSKLQKSEDESDNDSAVSSSQSSFSRCSPPPSPTACDDGKNEDARLLKAASVEAINRKNILASAKCRSGRDLNGSPVIQRKYEEDESSSSLEIEKPVIVKRETKEEKKFVHLRPVVQLREKVVPSLRTNQTKSLSVNDLRKSFEQIAITPEPIPQKNFTVRKEVKKSEVLPEKRAISKETVKTTPVVLPKEVKVETPISVGQRQIALCPEFIGGSIGITLAGGTDYETKEITVHKIRYGSVAYTDGRLKKGDRIISINGKTTANLTHAESVELLKEGVSCFVLIVEDGKEEVPSPIRRKSSDSRQSLEIRKSLVESTEKTPNHVITLNKNGTGLGFSIEGGKDSPQGDLPLRIKKIFQGGLADKVGDLSVGDEILVINDIDVRKLSRIETWSLMKKLPDGNVTIQIYR